MKRTRCCEEDEEGYSHEGAGCGCLMLLAIIMIIALFLVAVGTSRPTNSDPEDYSTGLHQQRNYNGR